jgi:hypothetical protein
MKDTRFSSRDSAFCATYIHIMTTTTTTSTFSSVVSTATTAVVTLTDIATRTAVAPVETVGDIDMRSVLFYDGSKH